MFKENATKSFVTVLVLCVLLIHPSIVNATTFTVGDSSGWGFNVQSWPNGKTFKVGDVLGMVNL